MTSVSLDTADRSPMLHEYRLAVAEFRLNMAVGPRQDRELLLLHGLGRQWQDFLPLLAALSIRFRVIAADLRGHGGSDRSDARYDLGLHTRSIEAFVRSHPGRPLIIYGHSLGALVSIGVAARCPERVAALVLEDPPSAGFLQRLGSTPYFATFEAMKRFAGSDLPIAEMARQLGEARIPGRNHRSVRLREVRDATSLRFLAACLRKTDPEVFTPPLEGNWLSGIDAPEELLRDIRCPVLLLAGEEALGGMFPSEDARRWSLSLSDSCLIECAGIGHQIHAMAPDFVLRHVFSFIEALEEFGGQGEDWDSRGVLV